MRIFHFMFLCLALLVGPLAAPLLGAPREVRLYAAPELRQSGLLEYVLPRFKLKTQIRVVLLPGPEGAEVVLASGAPEGVAALFEGPQGIYAAWAPAPAPETAAQRFLSWLSSDIGARTVAAFTKDGVQQFFPLERTPEVEEIYLPDGDPQAGRALALRNCGRCHVIGEENRMKGIESTPSFPVLRTLADWQLRFVTYYQRPPHPPFSQIEGLTEPFDVMKPPSIAPLALSLDEYNDILAFVARIAPADLGAPLELRR